MPLNRENSMRILSKVLRLLTHRREVVVEKTVLSAEEYEALERSLPNTVQCDTPEAYAYRLGVQHVLQRLRTGWVTR